MLFGSPFGERYARRRSRTLFRMLDREGIEYDPRQTAIRYVLKTRLFPWGLCRFSKCFRKELDRWVTVVGFENLAPLLDNGSGVLLLTGHFGIGLIVKVALAAKGYTVHNLRGSDGFVRRYGLTAGDLPFKEMYIEDDESPGLVRTTTKVRDLLRSGNIVMSTLDGNKRGGDDIWLPLMGYRRPFRTGLPVIAALAGARIVQYVATPREDGSIEVRFDRPFPAFLNDRSPVAYAEEIVRAFFQCLRAARF
jgi:lauroyl/myristoyl acyltransferase